MILYHHDVKQISLNLPDGMFEKIQSLFGDYIHRNPQQNITRQDVILTALSSGLDIFETTSGISISQKKGTKS